MNWILVGDAGLQLKSLQEAPSWGKLLLKQTNSRYLKYFWKKLLNKWYQLDFTFTIFQWFGQYKIFHKYIFSVTIVIKTWLFFSFITNCLFLVENMKLSAAANCLRRYWAKFHNKMDFPSPRGPHLQLFHSSSPKHLPSEKYLCSNYVMMVNS